MRLISRLSTSALLAALCLALLVPPVAADGGYPLSSDDDVQIRTGGKEISLACDVSPRQRNILLAGGMLNLLRKQK